MVPMFKTGLTSDDELFRDYMEGACHVFATALHRESGYSFLLLTDERKRERYAAGVPPVFHVYADDGRGTLYDVRGAHDREQVVASWQTLEETDGQPGQYGVRMMPNERALSKYVGDGDAVPLIKYSQAAVERALAVARDLGFLEHVSRQGIDAGARASFR
jgi:hypothetical protein